jgi:DNA-binding NarL/FixJ family response regulator
MIRTVVVEDNDSIRLLTTLNLEADVPECSVVGEARDGASGITMIRDRHADIAIVDLHMPGVSGLDLIARVRELGLDVQLVAYSADEGALQDSLAAGADAAVLKNGDIDALSRTVIDLTAEPERREA